MSENLANAKIDALFDEAQIRNWVKMLSEKIDAQMQALSAKQQGEFILLPILNAALIFSADLLRQLKSPFILETLRARSYHGTQSGDLDIPFTPLRQLEGAHVVIVDTIYDSGKTLRGVRSWLKAQSVASVHAVVLLSKWNSRTTKDYDWAAYENVNIKDRFLIGYGLDYNGMYRGLPYIGDLRNSSLKRDS